MAKFNQDLNEVLNQALNLALDLNHALCTTEHSATSHFRT